MPTSAENEGSCAVPDSTRVDTATEPSSVSVSSDPYSREVAADVDGYFEALRRERPVCPVAHDALVLVSRYDDVSAILRDNKTYANADRDGIGLEALKDAGLIPTDPDVLKAIGSGPAVHDTLIRSDAPDHTRQRKVVSRWFTPRSINEKWRSIIAGIAAELFDESAVHGSFDAMDALAVPLPIHTVAAILGVPKERRKDFKRWSDAFVASLGRRLDTSQWLAKIEAQHEMGIYFLDELRDRQQKPRADLLTLIAGAATTEDLDEARREGSITLLEALDMVEQILVAGNETTTQLLAVIVEQVIAHPELLDQVRADASIAPRIVEEALRIGSPVRGLFRFAASSAAVGESDVAQGKWLIPLYASANHDEEMFDEPRTFRLGRPNVDKHVAFGIGPHFCIGAHLARAEALVFVTELAERFERLEAGPRNEHDDQGSFMMRGRRRLLIRAAPRQVESRC